MHDVFLTKTKVVSLRFFSKLIFYILIEESHILKKTLVFFGFSQKHIIKIEYNRVKSVFCKKKDQYQVYLYIFQKQITRGSPLVCVDAESQGPEGWFQGLPFLYSVFNMQSARVRYLMFPIFEILQKTDPTVGTLFRFPYK